MVCDPRFTKFYSAIDTPEPPRVHGGRTSTALEAAPRMRGRGGAPTRVRLRSEPDVEQRDDRRAVHTRARSAAPSEAPTVCDWRRIDRCESRSAHIGTRLRVCVPHTRDRGAHTHTATTSRSELARSAVSKVVVRRYAISQSSHHCLDNESNVSSGRYGKVTKRAISSRFYQ